MAECLILKSGSKFDDMEVSARPENVRSGKRFMGRGSDESQVGALPVIGKITRKMGMNEKISIQAGIHGGEDVFSQSGIECIPGEMIDPGAGEQTISVTGCYLTTDTVVLAVENLRPGTVKAGVVIGDTTGNYQGFPDEE